MAHPCPIAGGELAKASLYHHVASKQKFTGAASARRLLTEYISAIATQELPADNKLRQMGAYSRLLIIQICLPYYCLNIVHWIKNHMPAALTE